VYDIITCLRLSAFVCRVTGKDPLLEKLEGKDINSVAGVLKLYFRELKDPLFPFHMFDDLMACSSNCVVITPRTLSLVFVACSAESQALKIRCDVKER